MELFESIYAGGQTNASTFSLPALRRNVPHPPPPQGNRHPPAVEESKSTSMFSLPIVQHNNGPHPPPPQGGSHATQPQSMLRWEVLRPHPPKGSEP
jgi:hypothetical protein